jgi:2-methylcitrate dehydratase PrpD
LGTAAVAARVLRLSPEATGHALGAAEYHGTLAPIMRCVELPGMVKDGVAWSAFSAICGVLQAAHGFTSTPSLFGAPEAEDLVDSIGREWLIEKLYFKPYCCCRWAQPAVRAALAVVARHAIAPPSIRSIRVETFAEACSLTRKVPATSEEAQYSVAWPVAAALLQGDVGPDQVLESALRDEQVIALMQKIEFRHRPGFQAEFPARRLAEVSVETGEAVYSSGTVSAHGDPDDPLSDSEIEDKFHRYTGYFFDEGSRRDMISRIWNLEVNGCRS